MEHELDKQRTQEFALKLFGFYTSGVLTLMVDIGHTTGLFDAAAKGRGGSQEIAARAGLGERYVREWPCAPAAVGVFEDDGASPTLPRPGAHRIRRSSVPASGPAPSAGRGRRPARWGCRTHASRSSTLPGCLPSRSST